ncbi:hypothetical protein, partial [Pseudoleptotrichia goodfellowii]
YRQQKEASRPAREEKVKEKKVLRKETPEGNVQEVTLDVEEEAVEEVKPKTPMEKLEYNAAKAKDRVDFYERVVRSVEREEKELNGYDEVIGKKKKVKKVVEKKVREPKKVNKKK